MEFFYAFAQAAVLGATMAWAEVRGATYETVVARRTRTVLRYADVLVLLAAMLALRILQPADGGLQLAIGRLLIIAGFGRLLWRWHTRGEAVDDDARGHRRMCDVAGMWGAVMGVVLLAGAATTPA